MAEMSAVMRERDRQADERMKAMTDTMQRRDMDSNVRMADLMMAMQDLHARRESNCVAAPSTAGTDSATGAPKIPASRYALYKCISPTSLPDGSTAHSGAC